MDELMPGHGPIVADPLPWLALYSMAWVRPPSFPVLPWPWLPPEAAVVTMSAGEKSWVCAFSLSTVTDWASGSTL